MRTMRIAGSLLVLGVLVPTTAGAQARVASLPNACRALLDALPQHPGLDGRGRGDQSNTLRARLQRGCSMIPPLPFAPAADVEHATTCVGAARDVRALSACLAPLIPDDASTMHACAAAAFAVALADVATGNYVSAIGSANEEWMSCAGDEAAPSRHSGAALRDLLICAADAAMSSDPMRAYARSTCFAGHTIPSIVAAHAATTVTTSTERCGPSSIAFGGLTCSSGEATCSRADAIRVADREAYASGYAYGIDTRMAAICVTPRRAAVLVSRGGVSSLSSRFAPERALRSTATLLVEGIASASTSDGVVLRDAVAFDLEARTSARDASRLVLVTLEVVRGRRSVRRYTSAVLNGSASGNARVATLDDVCASYDDRDCGWFDVLDGGRILTVARGPFVHDAMPPAAQQTYRYDTSTRQFEGPALCRMMGAFGAGSLEGPSVPHASLLALVTRLRAEGRIPAGLVDYDASELVTVSGEACPRTRLTLWSVGRGVSRSVLIGFDTTTGAPSFVIEQRD